MAVLCFKCTTIVSNIYVVCCTIDVSWVFVTKLIIKKKEKTNKQTNKRTNKNKKQNKTLTLLYIIN